MQYLKDTVRQRILTAAIQEFKEYGYSDASIRNIADNASISLGNIYRYYDNKEALYLAVVTPLLDAAKKLMDTQLVGLNQAEKVGAIVDFLLKNNDEILVVWRGNSKRHSEFVDFIVDTMAKQFDKLIADETGTFKGKHTNPDFTKIIANSFLHALLQVLSNPNNIEHRQQYVVELLLYFFGEELIPVSR